MTREIKPISAIYTLAQQKPAEEREDFLMCTTGIPLPEDGEHIISEITPEENGNYTVHYWCASGMDKFISVPADTEIRFYP